MQQETNVKVSMEHFMLALQEVRPSFGVSDESLSKCLRGQFIRYGEEFERLLKTGQMLVKQVEKSTKTPLLTVLIEGPVGSGKTALAAKLAMDSNFPFAQLVSPDSYVGFSENLKSSRINQVFEDAYRSPISIIILDNLERLLEYVPIGPRFSNMVLQSLLVLLKRVPQNENRRLMVIATTSSKKIIGHLQMLDAFNVHLTVPELNRPEHVIKVLEEVQAPVNPDELKEIANVAVPIGIKPLLTVIEMARSNEDQITLSGFLECIRACGLERHKETESSSLGEFQ